MMYKAKDNSETTLGVSIGASSVQIYLSSGGGSSFPLAKSGQATQAGDSKTLHYSGVGAYLATIAVVGDWINNLTDGSSAIIKEINSDSIITTDLEGGSTNTWANGDTFSVNTFIVTMNKRDSSGVISELEKIRIKNRETDRIDCELSDRGFGDTSPSAFSAGDYASLFVEDSVINEAQKKLSINGRKLNKLEHEDTTIDGVKEFSSLPLVPISAPTQDAQIASKKYLDDEVFGVLNDDLTISGKKTFGTVPASDQDPSSGDDLVRKSYLEANSPDATNGVYTSYKLKTIDSFSLKIPMVLSSFCSPSDATTAYQMKAYKDRIHIQALTNGTSFNSIDIKLRKTSAASPDLFLGVYYDDGTGDLGTLIQSKVFPVSTFSTTATEHTLTFDSVISIPDKTKIWIVYGNNSYHSSYGYYVYFVNFPSMNLGNNSYIKASSGADYYGYSDKQCGLVCSGINNVVVRDASNIDDIYTADSFFGFPQESTASAGDEVNLITKGILDGLTGIQPGKIYREKYLGISDSSVLLF